MTSFASASAFTSSKSSNSSKSSKSKGIISSCLLGAFLAVGGPAAASPTMPRTEIAPITSASTPLSANPAQGMKDSYLTLSDTIRAGSEFIEKHPFYDGSDQTKAQGYRLLMVVLRNTMELAWFANPPGQHGSGHIPQFALGLDDSRNFGIVNPDNLYRKTAVNPNHQYRIWGTRGTSATFILQPHRNDGEGLTPLTEDMMTIRDGKFEIFTGKAKALNKKNYLHLPNDAQTLVSRMTLQNQRVDDATGVAAEQHGEIHIERIVVNEDGTYAPVLGLEFPPVSPAVATLNNNVTAGTFAATLDAIMGIITRVWNEHDGARNVLADVGKGDPADGILPAQVSSLMTFELADDEAMILTTYDTKAKYQSVTAYDKWGMWADTVNRTGGMTFGAGWDNGKYRGMADADDLEETDGEHVFRFVISPTDPGVKNWIDTEGNTTGWIMLRYQAYDEDKVIENDRLIDDLQPTLQVVKRDQILEYLSPSTPDFDKADRNAQVKERQMEYQIRMSR